MDVGFSRRFGPSGAPDLIKNRRLWYGILVFLGGVVVSPRPFWSFSKEFQKSAERTRAMCAAWTCAMCAACRGEDVWCKRGEDVWCKRGEDVV